MPRKDAPAKVRSPSTVPPRARKAPTRDLPYVLRHLNLSIRMPVIRSSILRAPVVKNDVLIEPWRGKLQWCARGRATLAKRHGPQPTRPSEVAPAVPRCVLTRPIQLISTSIIRSSCMVAYGYSTGIPSPLCFGSVRQVHRAGGTNVPSSSVRSCERGQRLSNHQSRGSDPMSGIGTSFNAY